MIAYRANSMWTVRLPGGFSATARTFLSAFTLAVAERDASTHRTTMEAWGGP